MPRFILASAVLLLSHTVVASPLNEYFSLAAADAYAETALTALGGSSTLSDKDYATRLLTMMGKGVAALGFKSSGCASSKTGLSSGDLEQIHNGASLQASLGCNAEVPADAVELVQAALQRDDLWSIYLGTLSSKHLGLDLDGEGMLEKLMGLLLPDGSVRSTPGTTRADRDVAMVAELLAELVPGSQSATALAMVNSFKEKHLDANPTLVAPLNLARGDKISLKPTRLKSLTRNILEASYTDSPESMLHVYEALVAIADYPKCPLSISLHPSSPSVETLASGGVRLQITTLLGAPAPVESVSLTGLTRPDEVNVLEAGDSGGGELGPQDSNGFRSLPSTTAMMGMYMAEFKVVLEGESKVMSAHLPVSVKARVELLSARVAVSTSKAPSSPSLAEYTLSPGEGLPETVQASTLDGHHIHVEFEISGEGAGGGSSGRLLTTPHQTFVRLTHVLTGLDTFFVARPEKSGQGDRGSGKGKMFAAVVSLGEETGTFLQRSGAYSISVLVGDPLLDHSVVTSLGVIDLDFPVTKAREWPLYARALLHDSDVTLGALPEKHHTFRQPDTRPRGEVSLLFTALVLAPLAVLAYGFKLCKADLKRLPAMGGVEKKGVITPTAGGGLAWIWCVAFQMCVGAVLILFVVYWVTLTMAEMLKVLGPLVLVAGYTGSKALRALSVAGEGGLGSGQGKVGGETHVKAD